MNRLAGFKYRQIIKKLKTLGFEFDRQAAGAHEIWVNRATNKYTTTPITEHVAYRGRITLPLRPFIQLTSSRLLKFAT